MTTPVIFFLVLLQVSYAILHIPSFCLNCISDPSLSDIPQQINPPQRPSRMRVTIKGSKEIYRFIGFTGVSKSNKVYYDKGVYGRGIKNSEKGMQVSTNLEKARKYGKHVCLMYVAEQSPLIFVNDSFGRFDNVFGYPYVRVLSEDEIMLPADNAVMSKYIKAFCDKKWYEFANGLFLGFKYGHGDWFLWKIFT